jgi:hypothetical protein
MVVRILSDDPNCNVDDKKRLLIAAEAEGTPLKVQRPEAWQGASSCKCRLEAGAETHPRLVARFLTDRVRMNDRLNARAKIPR